VPADASDGSNPADASDASSTSDASEASATSDADAADSNLVDAWTGPLASAPLALASHSVVLDPVRDHLLVFGGEAYHDVSAAVLVLDLGAGSGASWAALSPSGSAPPPVHQHTAVYDVAGDRMIVFGGKGYYDTYASVWALDFTGGAAGQWQALSTTGGPSPRARHASAYDPTSRRMFVFGGEVAYDLSAELWALDLGVSPPAWARLHDGGAPSPGPRRGAGLAFDSIRGRLLAVGGDGFYDRFADVWAFDLVAKTWSQLAPAISTPLPPIADAAVAFQASADRLLVFGGAGYYDLSPSVFTLAFTGSANGLWSVRAPTIGTPGPTTQACGVVDPGGLFDVVLGLGYDDLLATSVRMDP
jgi:hypothetical protein